MLKVAWLKPLAGMALLNVVALAESFAKMRASRGINPSKIPGKRVIKRKDNPDDVDMYAAGGPIGLYANIHAKQERIKHGSKEKMRKPGSKGAPTAEAFKQSAKTAKR
jgi:hypothetical protein